MKKSFSSADELDGYEDLKEEDQERINKAWEEGKVADEDIPESARKPKDDEDGEGEEKPKKKKAPAKKAAKKAKKDEDDDEEEEEKPKKKRAPAKKKEVAPKKKATKKKKKVLTLPTPHSYPTILMKSFLRLGRIRRRIRRRLHSSHG